MQNYFRLSSHGQVPGKEEGLRLIVGLPTGPPLAAVGATPKLL